MSFVFLCPEEGCQQGGIHWGEGRAIGTRSNLGQAEIHLAHSLAWQWPEINTSRQIQNYFAASVALQDAVCCSLSLSKQSWIWVCFLFLSLFSTASYSSTVCNVIIWSLFVVNILQDICILVRISCMWEKWIFVHHLAYMHNFAS